MRDRLISQGKKTQSGEAKGTWELNIRDTNTGGIELPNDFDGKGHRVQKNLAKIKNIDPAWMEEPGTDRSAWGKIANESWKVTKELKRPNGIANADESGEIKHTLGPWFVQVGLEHDRSPSCRRRTSCFGCHRHCRTR